MRIEVSNANAASVWEVIVNSKDEMTAEEISNKSGVYLNDVLFALGNFERAGILSKRDDSNIEEVEEQPISLAPVKRGRGRPRKNPIVVKKVFKKKIFLYKAIKKINSISYAMAIEAGIPLKLLEKTVILTLSEKNEALLISATGKIEDIKKQRINELKEKKRIELKGRAASKASATELAKLIKDISKIIPIKTEMGDDVKEIVYQSKTKDGITEAEAVIKKEIAVQAAKALNSLIQAIEKNG